MASNTLSSNSTQQLTKMGNNTTSTNQPQKLDLATAQKSSNQAVHKQAASTKPNKVVKPCPREKASLFHKPQKRGPLAAMAATKVNTLGKDNEKHYDLVAAKLRYHKDTYTVPSARGYAPRTVTKKMAVPRFLISPRPVVNSASKELLELIEQGRAEKQRQKEIDALFDFDSDN
ncbi:uncharacterized protein A1O5_00614 [Cladophialophora psammophila CBS 110553]|uniref:Uncharacterized protein n=1 Tax=Cladophialophora psammophila CBS 110553 TaxID=1182543 RepID=W9XGM5_9EURO|nr:uncharacterized protein A1O5_00614 [Cladophialophora psammophila CBS 110553]EXJ76106.1 hypothetical protein A1O5_00614 [Cladophialophora psammophila CBS 110553]